MTKVQTECKRCGTCCVNGGPALHTEDLPLIQKGLLPQENLVSIRRAEPVFSPLTDLIEPAKSEFIKVAGSNKSWKCCFYQDDTGCSIYKNRPKECKLLKCWDTSDLLKNVYKDSLQRRDIIPLAHPIMEYITIHDLNCSFEKIQCIVDDAGKSSYQDNKNFGDIALIIQTDFKIRQHAVRELHLSLTNELFYFGRPMFQSLPFYNLQITESSKGIEISRNQADEKQGHQSTNSPVA